VDTDPVRLAARSLVARLRAEEYKEGDMLGAYGPVLDDVEAVNAVMQFAETVCKPPETDVLD
jgi:hypothetical protein